MLLGLTGCDLYQPDVDSMLAPPVLSELQTEVNEALQDVVGQDFRLCYPTGGSYRSPYIFADLDGDENEDSSFPAARRRWSFTPWRTSR